MENFEDLTLHRRAVMALDTLSHRERAKVEEALRLLRDPKETLLVRARTARLSTPDAMFIMRASPSIRLLFRRTENGIEVLDIVRRDTLSSFANKSAHADDRSSANPKWGRMRRREGKNHIKGRIPKPR